jgi:hypothetical protein
MRILFVKFVTLLVMFLSLASCGNAPSNVLSGLMVSSENRNNNIWVSFSADLNLGAMSFAAISLPIIHPRGNLPIGKLELTPGFSGISRINISLDITSISDVRTSNANLPNGNMIPLIANNQVIAINIGSGARIYLALSEKVVALGVAVPISAFDEIGQKLPGLNLFPVINMNGVVASAGIFTGALPGQNGIAVVADVSSALRLDSPSAQSQAVLSLQAQQVNEALRLDLKPHTISEVKKSQLDQIILGLHRRKAVLRMKR